MRITLKRIGKVVLIVLMILMIAAVIFLRFMHFRHSDNKYTKKIGEDRIAFEIKHRHSNNGSVRFVENGDSTKTELVFLHGAPGSSKDYTKYLKDSALIATFRVKAFDRPGYGYSEYGQYLFSIKDQADAVAPYIKDSSVVVGHSYGGPVAAAVAMYHPEKVKELVLLAPAIDPVNEKQFRINHIIKQPPLIWALSPAFRVALKEKLEHKEALEAIMSHWEKITCPVTVAHGKKDWIVPVENVDFLQSKLSNASLEVIRPDDMSHLMIWDDFKWVRALLLEKNAPKVQ